jgi:hypothetical protein
MHVRCVLPNVKKVLVATLDVHAFTRQGIPACAPGQAQLRQLPSPLSLWLVYLASSNNAATKHAASGQIAGFSRKKRVEQED